MLARYIIRQRRHRHGKRLAQGFMPNTCRSARRQRLGHMHTHLSPFGRRTSRSWLSETDTYAGLSDLGMFAIGGLLRHALGALRASPTPPPTATRTAFVPGFEASTKLSYSRKNRAAVIRFPCTARGLQEAAGSSTARCARQPRRAANPYLLYSAMLMAALDGIQTKARPGDPLDKDIYDLAPEELADVPTVPGTLDESLEALRLDHEFLLRGDVSFTPTTSSTLWIWYKRGRTRSRPCGADPIPSNSPFITTFEWTRIVTDRPEPPAPLATDVEPEGMVPRFTSRPSLPRVGRRRPMPGPSPDPTPRPALPLRVIVSR